MRKPDLNVRIAVTGVGIICSIGRNKEEVWRSIVESRAGIGKLTRFPGETFPTDIAAEVNDIRLPIAKRDARTRARTWNEDRQIRMPAPTTDSGRWQRGCGG